MRTTRILGLSDLHLVSKQPKTAFGEPCPNNRPKEIQDLLDVMPEDERRKYAEYFAPGLKPVTQLEFFSDLLPLVAKRINEAEIDFIVFDGDIFDISRKPGRDTEIHEDTFAAIKQFVEAVTPPMFFLPGNADIFSRKDFYSSVSKLGELNEIGQYKVRNKSGKMALVFARNGNFVIERDDCSIFGLNSVGVNNYGFHRYENMGFLDKFIRSPNPKPVVLFTHHPPFRVLPREVTSILGSGLPSQQWILTALGKYSSDTDQRTVVTSGHCHKELDAYNGLVEEICLLPMLKKLEVEEAYNIGSILQIEGEEVQVSKLWT